MTARLAALALVLALPTAAAGQTTPAPAATVIAQRGAMRLTAGELRDLLEHADPAQRAQLAANPTALGNFVRERLLQAALATEARAKSWDQRPEVIARMNDAREAALAQSYLAGVTQPDPSFPTEADIATAYEANKSRFLLPKQYHLAQIAILVPAGAPREADDEAHRKASDLRAQALRPRADFAELARRSSQERGAAERGGELGWVREDQLVPAVKEAVTALAEGAVSEPVRTASGWHVVKLLGIRPPATAALADVHDQLVQALRASRQQEAARLYVDDLLRREPIQLNEIDLGRVLAPR